MMQPRHYNWRGKPTLTPPSVYDRTLFYSTLALILLGLMMVASSSIVISEQQYHEPFHYLFRQGIYILMGFVLAIVAVRVPIDWWRKISGILLLGSLALLILVLIPGIGHKVNGSIRWIGYGALRLQVSELAKFAFVLYFAGYIVRHGEALRQDMYGFVKPLLVMGVMSFLLMLEPDFGATVVVLATGLSLLFLAGACLWQFILLLGVAGTGAATLALISPYRVARLTSFWNPWENPFDSSYQLTQSLIAFGRGGWFGVGLGESVQKMFYLPEAHTDFLFAVLVEELGLVGTLVVIALFVLLIWRCLAIGRYALKENAVFGAFVSYGFGILIAIQAIVNIGVNAGLLPTKGLTLPLMSSGGSSMIINCLMIALILRIDYETRRKA